MMNDFIETMKATKVDMLNRITPFIPEILTTWDENDVKNNFHGEIKITDDIYDVYILETKRKLYPDKNDTEITLKLTVTVYPRYNNLSTQVELTDNNNITDIVNYTDFIPSTDAGLYTEFIAKNLEVIKNLEYDEERKYAKQSSEKGS